MTLMVEVKSFLGDAPCHFVCLTTSLSRFLWFYGFVSMVYIYINNTYSLFILREVYKQATFTSPFGAPPCVEIRGAFLGN